VAVDFDSMPAEGPELFSYGCDIHYLGDFTVYLQAVHIDHGAEIV